MSIREIAASNIDSHWQEWLLDAQSFRYVPRENPPLTVRREKSKRGDGDYWYGYRKANGKLHKRYIGKSEDLTVDRLEEIAALLNAPTQPRQKNSSFSPTSTVTSLVRESDHTEEIARLQAENTRLQSELHNAAKKLKA